MLVSLRTLLLSLAVCLACSHAQAEDVLRQIRDIADQSADASVAELMQVGNLLFFRADDGVSGNELWVSDGTPEGTRMARDIQPGEDSSSPDTFADFAGLLYFFAVDSTGRGLWKSDGTEAGTVLVKDFDPTRSDNALVSKVVEANGHLYFAASTQGTGEEIWKSDGTTEGTAILKEVNTEAGEGRIYDIAAAGDLLYFTPEDSVNGSEIWVSDGTAEGTHLLSDQYPGAEGSNPSYLYGHDGLLYFQARDTEHGYEPWVTDGTPEGTRMLADLNPAGDSSPRNFVAANGLVYFLAHNESSGDEPFVTDGTPAGTRLLKDISPTSGSGPRSFFAFHDKVFFQASDGVTGSEMWVTDGTTEGTMLFKDNDPTIIENPPPAPPTRKSGGFNDPVILNDTLYFAAGAAGTGTELFSSDGTPEGTSLLTEVNPGEITGYRGYLTLVNGLLFFSGFTPENGTTLWKSDGTAEGTQAIERISQISSSSAPNFFTRVGDVVFFHANDSEGTDALWKTDGTEDGTVMVKEVGAGASSHYTEFTAWNDLLVFTSRAVGTGREPFVSDGTPDGTTMLKDIVPGTEDSLPDQFTPAGERLFFATRGEADGGGLWVSDGTEAGTQRLKDISPETTSSGIRNLTAVGDRVFFNGSDLTHGAELWTSDGTPEGTVLVRDIIEGEGASIPENLTDVNGVLYFSAANAGAKGVDTASLWTSDGTPEGTVPVFDVYPGGDPRMSVFHAVGDILYFVADDGVHGEELWRSDGTPEGTRLVKDIWLGQGDSFINEIVDIQGRLYFAAAGQDTSLELWTSDGTLGGTQVAADVLEEGGVDPESLTVLNGVLYFTADDEVHGRELWKSRGTRESTELVGDLREGIFEGELRELTAGDDFVVFSANNGSDGIELWGAFPEFEVAYIRRADGDPTVEQTLGFEVSFNRPVTGVSLEDFVIDESGSKGVSGASLTSVEGSGDIYLVLVNRGAGDGTLSIDLVDDDSIVLAGTSTPLGGAGAGNGDFSAGEFYTVDSGGPEVTADITFTNRPSPVLYGDVDDPDAIVTVTVDGNTVEAENFRDGRWFVVGDALPEFAEGVYDVQVVGTDIGGNVGVDTTTNELTIDLTAPMITVTRQVTGAANPVLRGTINEATSRIELRWLGANADAVNNGDGTWSVAASELLPENDGTYDIEATATDLAGNTGTDTSENEYLRDTTPPNVLLIGEAEMTLIAGQDNYVESGVSIGDLDPSPSLETTGSVDDGTPGVYVLTYTAVDHAGNRSETLTRRVTVLASGEGEGEGEPEPPLCRDAKPIVNQYALFHATVTPEDDDIDDDGVPEEFAVALVNIISCTDFELGMAVATHEAFAQNRTVLLSEENASQYSYAWDLLAVYMSISTTLQEAVAAELNDFNPDITLTGQYAVVTCLTVANCSVDPTKGGAEFYSGAADLDGDGFSNAQEAANVIARGGNALDYARSAIQASLDGTTDTTVGAGIAFPCGDLSVMRQDALDYRTEMVFDRPDIDLDGMPDDFLRELVISVACGDDTPLRNATLDAYSANSRMLQGEAQFEYAQNYEQILPLYLLASGPMRLAVRNSFVAQNLRLDADYVIVECTDGVFCAPTVEEGKGALPQQPYAGFSDLDGDGLSNAEEAANVIARGGSATEFAAAAQDASLNGTETGGEGEGEGEAPGGCNCEKGLQGGVDLRDVLGNLFLYGLTGLALLCWQRRERI